MSQRADILREGAQILQTILAPHGFSFQMRGEGQSSGGTFVWGEFVRGDRRLKLHFRHSLGMVEYHIADHHASHQSYMQEIGVVCRYPGFSEHPVDAFEDLAHDIALATDFLCGTGDALRTASEKEDRRSAVEEKDFMASAAGDLASLARLQNRFRKGDYREVIEIAGTVHYSENLEPSIQKMIEIAKKRLTGNPPKG